VFWKRWGKVIIVGLVGIVLLGVGSATSNIQLSEDANDIGMVALVAALVVWLLRMKWGT
jgi:hypothetical protein